MRGYMTVEAACIMPIVLYVQIFLLYLMFYQYDRCLLEQDTVLAAVKGEERLAGREKERYLAFRGSAAEVKKGVGTVKAKMEGEVILPFSQIAEWLGGRNMKMKAAFEKWEVDPVFWIRLYQKTEKEGAENAED